MTAEEQASRRTGHFFRGEKGISGGQIVTSVISLTAVCAVIVYFIVRTGNMPRFEGTLSAGDGNEFSVKLVMLYEEVLGGLNSGSAAEKIRYGAQVLACVVCGLLAGKCDLIFGMIPGNKRIPERYGFAISPAARFLPAAVMTLTRVLELAAERFGGEWQDTAAKAAGVLFAGAWLFLLVEIFCNAGLVEMFVRVPAALVSNAAVLPVLYSAGNIGIIIAVAVFVITEIIYRIMRRKTADDHR